MNAAQVAAAATFAEFDLACRRSAPNVLDSVFFLYMTEDDAKAGVNAKATGFIVSVGDGNWLSKDWDYYGVTTWHAAVRDGNSIIRINREDGGTDILPFDPCDWHFIPGGDDVAVVPLQFDNNVHRAGSVSSSLFAGKIDAEWRRNQHGIGVGDDVFMLGLFVDHEGHATNTPKARFGNISMMAAADAPIEQPNGYKGESYILDMHSRDGFSGSPVFMYRTFGGDLTAPSEVHLPNLDSLPLRGGATLRSKPIFAFLGMHWGQFSEPMEVLERAESSKPQYLKGRSGMTCVIPSWKILEVLNLPKFRDARAARRAAKDPKKSADGIAAESAAPTKKEGR